MALGFALLEESLLCLTLPCFARESQVCELGSTRGEWEKRGEVVTDQKARENRREATRSHSK